MDYQQLASQAAALETAHDYEAANKLWQQALDIGNEKQKLYASRRAAFCEIAITREWH